MRRWLSPSIAAVLLLTSGCLAFFSARIDSATDDEPAHITAGYLEVAHGRFGLFPEQPPLIDSIAALPLVGAGYELPRGWDAKGANPWRTGAAFLYRSGNDADAMLLRARMPILGMFLLLCVAVYFFVHELTGSGAAALLGTALAAFCPNLLAHARLATVDLGTALFCALAVFAYLRFLRSPTTGRACVAGVCIGLAILTKVSSLLILPWAGIVATAYLIGERRRWEDSAAAALPRMLLIVVVALATFESVYLIEMRSLDLGAPLHEYGRAVTAVFGWVSDAYPQPQFLLGSFSATGWWYYYFVGILLKTPLTTLLLFAFLPVGLLLPTVERRFEVWCIVAFVTMFLGVASATQLAIGLRYILPVYPMLYVLVAVVAARVVRSTEGVWRPRVAAGLALAAAGSAVVGIAAYPGYLSYFNAFVRSEDADRYMVDSNLDWGQDLRRLERWVDQNHVAALRTWYFGGGDPAYYLGDKARPLTGCEIDGDGLYAISRHYYRVNPGCEPTFRDARRVATIGGSIVVFEVPAVRAGSS